MTESQKFKKIAIFKFGTTELKNWIQLGIHILKNSDAWIFEIFDFFLPLFAKLEFGGFTMDFLY